MSSSRGNVDLRSAESVLLARFVSSAALVDQRLNLISTSGDIARFLGVSLLQGDSLLKLLPDHVLVQLPMAMQRAVAGETGVRLNAVLPDADRTLVSIEIVYVGLTPDRERTYWLVFSEPEASRATSPPPPIAALDRDQTIVELNQALIASNTHLRTAVPQHRATNEELHAANEEIRCSNDEIRTASEELRVAQVELQTANYELEALNAELQSSLTQVERAREYAEATVETLPQPLLVLDATFRIHKGNRAFYEQFQMTPAEVDRRLIFEIAGGAWDLPQLRSAPHDGELWTDKLRMEHVFPRIGRRVLLLTARRVPWDLSVGPLILLGMEDVTERELDEGRARALVREQVARKEADAANRSKDQFLATLSHELRTPLSAIMTWIRLLQMHRLDEKTTDRGLDALDRNARNLNQLIDDLLDVSRIISGKLRLEVTSLQLAPLVEASVETVRASADGKRLRVNLDLDHAAGPVLGDATRLQQVIVNLLSNAVKFTPPAGSIDVMLQRDTGRVCLTVRDSGRGISRDVLPFIFDRFRQADASPRGGGGLGLGLAIVRHLVELHGGTVKAESDGEGTGAAFTISLPITGITLQVGDERARLVTKSGVPGSPSVAGVSVLFVDDEADAREAFGLMLSQYGAQVFMAASAAEAFAAVQDLKPDVLVSDIGMPDEDGLSLIRRVRALPTDRGGCTPAIALTAFARSEDSSRALAAGFQRHCGKPIDSGDLTQAIVEVIHAARTAYLA